MEIIIARGCGPSGRALRGALGERGFRGNIRWGFAGQYANKELALKTMREAGVPTPRPVENVTLGAFEKPIVGRTATHKGGNGFWLCQNVLDVAQALKNGATHFMEYIDGAREFRVHVVDGKSIKISEKIGGGVTRNHRYGSVCRYPHDFEQKDELREIGKAAVAALELPFGAADVLYKDGEFYVLEVNSGPCLTDQNSDTLERYANAFMEQSNG